MCSSDLDFFQQTFYSFDYPDLSESGCVTVTPYSVTLKLPEKSNGTFKDRYIYHQSVMLFINSQLRFSYEWAPIYTFNDYLKLQEIIGQAFFECKKMFQWTDKESPNFKPKYHNQSVSEYSTQFYNIKCLETKFTTSLELNIFINNDPPQTNAKRFQLYIGNNLVFCSDRELKCIDLYHRYGLIMYMLFKLGKW